MADINKIIKELWQKTYRNQDIDHIQACPAAPVPEPQGCPAEAQLPLCRALMPDSAVSMLL